MKMIGVKRVANFAGASNPIQGIPGEPTTRFCGGAEIADRLETIHRFLRGAACGNGGLSQAQLPPRN
jgi:hypothetical protein